MLVPFIRIHLTNGTIVEAKSITGQGDKFVIEPFEEGAKNEYPLGEIVRVEHAEKSVPPPGTDVTDPTLEPQVLPRERHWASPHSPDHPDNQAAAGAGGEPPRRGRDTKNT